jgi:hypothetical protein
MSAPTTDSWPAGHRWTCWWHGVHVPVRQPATGGFRCELCGKPGADLAAMGYLGCDYVSPGVHTTFDRLHQAITREDGW